MKKYVTLLAVTVVVLNGAYASDGIQDSGEIKVKHYNGDGLNNLWAFGDSMTDQYMNKLSGKNAETWDGVNANGEGWVAWLAKMGRVRTDQRKNFAVSGAMTNDGVYGGADSTVGNPWGKKWSKMGMKSQLALFKSQGGKFGENDLVVLWGAGNDFLKFIDAGSRTANNLGDKSAVSDTDVDRNVAGVANNVKDMLESVKQLGGKNILAPNWVDMTDTPGLQVLGIKGTGGKQVGDGSTEALAWKEGSRKYWQKYSAQHAQKVQEFAKENPDISVYYVDIMSAYNYMLNNHKMFGFTDRGKVGTCLGDLKTAGTLKTDAINYKARNNCDGYISWDGTHATSGTQKLIAEAYNSVIQLPRLNRMIISMARSQVNTALSLSDATMVKMANGEPIPKFALQTPKMQGGVGGVQTSESDGRMTGKTSISTLSFTTAITQNIGTSFGYVKGNGSTNAMGYSVDQDTYAVSFYGVKPLEAKSTYIAWRTYASKQKYSNIARSILNRKVSLSGNTNGQALGFNVKYNTMFSHNTNIYMGVGFDRTTINAYTEDNRLKTGLGIKFGTIKSDRFFAMSGFKKFLPKVKLMNRTFNTSLRMGVELDLANKVDGYTITSLSNNVDTNIQARNIDQSALTLGLSTAYTMSDSGVVSAFVNARKDRTASSYVLGLSYTKKF